MRAEKQVVAALEVSWLIGGQLVNVLGAQLDDAHEQLEAKTQEIESLEERTRQMEIELQSMREQIAELSASSQSFAIAVERQRETGAPLSLSNSSDLPAGSGTKRSSRRWGLSRLMFFGWCRQCS